MTDKQKIKEEIERLKHTSNAYDRSRFMLLLEIEDFINSLPEEPASEDLEKELHSWMRENCDDNGFFNQLDLARHFAEWQKKKSMQDFLEKSEKWLAIHMPFGEVSQESVYDCIQEFKNYMQDEM